MHKKSKLSLVIILGLMLCSAAFFVVIFFVPNIYIAGNDNEIVFIKNATTIREIENAIIENHNIKNRTTFRIVAFIFLQHKCMTGAYMFKDGISNFEAVMMLRRMLQTPVDVIINNVRDVNALAKKISNQLACSKEAILTLLNNEEHLFNYGFTKENILAMFIPNTYKFYWTINPESMLQKFHNEYKKFWSGWREEKCKNLNITPIQVYILASIVNMETLVASEKPIIAGVYINRLKKNMPLCADPTISFIVNGETLKRIKKSHIEIVSPYNTYKNKGLPPGPICMPDIESIDAVLNFAKHNFFYFCVNDAMIGTHIFENNYESHCKNARRYRKKLDSLRIK